MLPFSYATGQAFRRAANKLKQTVPVSAMGLGEALLTARDGRATVRRREADGVFDVGGLVEDGLQQRRVAGRRAHDAVGGRLQWFRERSLHASPHTLAGSSSPRNRNVHTHNKNS